MSYTYNPAAIVADLSGYVIPSKDFARDRFISVRPEGPEFEKILGIRGKHTWVHNRNRSGEIKITLMQTSEANRVFSNIVQMDSVNLTGRLHFNLKDVEGSSLVAVTDCRILGIPEIVYSGDQEAREWTIGYLYTNILTVGGNRNPLIEF